jgi:hypothetical protein
MAQFCDEQAEVMGELDETNSGEKPDGGALSLVDRVVEGNTDCCGGGSC